MSAVMQSAPVSAAERSFDFYATEYTTPARFYEWLASASSERAMSAFWGSISNAELRALLLGTLDYEQYVAVMATLKRRFVQEHSAEIAELVSSEDQTPDNSWMARQDKALGAGGVTA